MIVVSVLMGVILDESPRHLYEFYEYDKMTEFFQKNLDSNDINKFYKSKLDQQIQSELEKNRISNLESSIFSLCNLEISRRSNNFSILMNNYSELYRSNLIIKPFILLSIMKQNKYIRKHFLILACMLFNIAIVYNLTIINIFKSFVISHSDLYSIFNYRILILCITFYLSQMFFYFIVKFFGYQLILFICFSMTFIFTLIFQLQDIDIRVGEDMNKYYFNSIFIVFHDKRSTLFGLYNIILFFSYGLKFSVHMYLVKYTKTIYRCFFFGICEMIFSFFMVFSNGLDIYFEKNMFYISVASIYGFIITNFLNTEFDYSIVSDYRKLELNSNEKNKDNPYQNSY